jgi:hypothetical protein
MKKVQHMVLVRFKPGMSQQRIDQLFADLAGLRQTIPGILHYSWGPYASPEGLHGGFTHGFLMTFQSAAARDTYLTHPEHEKVKEGILPVVENVIAFDFEETT